MKKQVFVIRDTKIGAYDANIFTAFTSGEAERMFLDVAKNPQSNIGKWPTDYDLFHLGEYDQATGLISPNDTPKHIVKAVDLLSITNGNQMELATSNLQQ